MSHAVLSRQIGVSASTERQRRSETLFERALRGPGAAREAALAEVVVMYLPVARNMAGRYNNRGCELEDLEQVAYLALVKAARDFDPTAGFAFMAYAAPSIRGTLRRYFRDFGWTVRPPRSLQELQPRVWEALAQTDVVTGRPPSEHVIAARLGTTTAAVREAAAVSGCFAPASLDALLPDTDGCVLADVVPGDGDLDFEAAELRCLLEGVLRQLSISDLRLLRLRFVDELSQTEMAGRLGIGQSHVSRRLTSVLARLRSLLEPPERSPLAG